MKALELGQPHGAVADGVDQPFLLFRGELVGDGEPLEPLELPQEAEEGRQSTSSAGREAEGAQEGQGGAPEGFGDLEELGDVRLVVGQEGQVSASNTAGSFSSEAGGVLLMVAWSRGWQESKKDGRLAWCLSCRDGWPWLGSSEAYERLN